MSCLYTVYRCRSKISDERVGFLHHSDNCQKTLCGKNIDDGWYVSDNTMSGTATCPACIRIDKETIVADRLKQ